MNRKELLEELPKHGNDFSQISFVVYKKLLPVYIHDLNELRKRIKNLVNVKLTDFDDEIRHTLDMLAELMDALENSNDPEPIVIDSISTDTARNDSGERETIIRLEK